MEKFKEGLMYVACIILPPVMLVLFILGMAAIMSWGFHNIGTKEDQSPSKTRHTDGSKGWQKGLVKI